MSPAFGQAAVLAAVLGAAVPLVASVGPARRALKRTLSESLDLYHQVVKQGSNAGERWPSTQTNNWLTSWLALVD